LLAQNKYLINSTNNNVIINNHDADNGDKNEDNNGDKNDETMLGKGSISVVGS
ncbi:307_t:CDS:1, partial [Entrophospora sp. SA101]